MQKAVIAILIIANIAFSSAVFLKKPTQATFQVFSQLEEIESHDFGKKILDTIALQLKNKGPLQDIAKLLSDIRTGLVTEQSDSDQLHSQQEAECDTEVKEFDRRIDQATAIQAATESEITTLKQEIAQLTAEIRNKGIQIDILGRREIDLKDSRVRDAEDFARRQEQSTNVVAALEIILDKFNSIQGEEKQEAVMAELSRIGNNNPIMALVEVASSFSQESLDKVRSKLEQLREQLIQSIEDDKVNEQAAIGEYGALLHELEETLASIQTSKEDDENKLKQVQTALSFQEKILKDAVDELLSAQNGKAAKLAQCEEWRNKWAADKEQRTKEINLVKQVENIIATKLDTMKDYLKERAGLN